MRPIAVFYHCLVALETEDNVLPRACSIIQEQMECMRSSGLLDACGRFVVGINGGPESWNVARLFIPSKATPVLHGINSRAENLTIVEIQNWAPKNPGWDVLYFHAKGCTHPIGSSYGEGVSDPWRRTMTEFCVNRWRQCVSDLEHGFESAGCHFMRGMADGTQNLWAGNFWWATSDFLKTVPSIFLRDRIKQSGIASKESRYEAEVWIGNGRLPRVKEYLPSGGHGCP